MNPIVLIGPMGAGKSTVGSELAKISGLRQVPMDFICWYYYFKQGYSLEEEDALESKKEVTRYLRRFQLNALENAVKDFPECIIDFGAGHSFYEDQERLDRAKKALHQNPNVFLLLPHKDPKVCEKICFERLKERKNEKYARKTLEMNKLFIYSQSNKELAKHIIESGEMTAEETAAIIWDLSKKS